MKISANIKTALAGFAAGAVNGLFGAGGGMILVPALGNTEMEESEIFPASVCIILPACVVSLVGLGLRSSLPWLQAAPYLVGSAAGGILAGKWGCKIPVKWLHRVLGVFILYGGVRYLW